MAIWYRPITNWEGAVVNMGSEEDMVIHELTPELLSTTLSHGINLVNSPFQNKKFASSLSLADGSPLTLE